MTRRRLLLWGSLVTSVVLALVDTTWLPWTISPTASISAPVAPAPNVRAHPAVAASQATASAGPSVASEASATSADVEGQDSAAARRELLAQARAFVTGGGPTVGDGAIVVPTPRETLIDADGTPAQQRLFVSQNWGPPPPPPSSTPVPSTPLPPSAPPMPFTYLGKAQAGDTWEVYLARGDKTFIVHDNSVVDDVYRVESIKPPRLSLIYIPLNQQQSLDIGATQ